MAGDGFAGGVESSLRLVSFSCVLLLAVVVGDGDVSFVGVGCVVVELSACDSGQIYE